MRLKIYSFKAKLWKYKGHAAWHFLTLPPALSKKIRMHHWLAEEGWGRLKVSAKIGYLSWESAIWYDSKLKNYLLPIKANIRKKEKLTLGQEILVVLSIKEVDKKLIDIVKYKSSKF